MSRENEINAMYVNCQVEGIQITREECEQLYDLVTLHGYNYEEALKRVNER